MKRFFLILITIGSILWVGGYLFYRFYLPELVARAIIADETPDYIPQRLMNKVDELRKPVNKGVNEIILEMKKNNIPLEDFVTVIENTSGDEAYEFLNELNQHNPKSPDEVFDLAKKHIDADFDVELFREPFVKNITMNSIKQAMNYANTNKITKDLDIETGRAIAKRILIDKYKQLELHKKSN